MTTLPSPTEISYFLELAQSQNMSRAAERLGIRQPTLSMALAKLEQTVGAQLFTRTKKGVVLTDAGNILLVKAEHLLNAWGELKTQTAQQSEQVQGQIRLGCHVSVALYSLPQFLPETLKAFPNLEFSLEHDFSRKITESVISLKLDLGIVVNPVQHPDLVIKKLAKDEVTFWRKEKLASELQKVLIADNQLVQSQTLLRKLKKNAPVFEKYLTTSSLELARDLALAGAGVAILPAKVAAMGAGKLHRLPGLPTYHDEICLIYRTERRTSKTLQMLSQKIQSVFTE